MVCTPPGVRGAGGGAARGAQGDKATASTFLLMPRSSTSCLYLYLDYMQEFYISFIFGLYARVLQRILRLKNFGKPLLSIKYDIAYGHK